MTLQQLEYRTSAACSEGCGGACVEVATNLPGVISLRDTAGSTVTYTTEEWTAFLSGAKRGEFDPAD